MGYSATQSATLTAVMHHGANGVTGNYTVGGFGTEQYDLHQTLTPANGGTLTVTESGTAWTQTNGYGAGLIGAGTQTVTGSDKYTLIETGTDVNGAMNISAAGLADAQEVTTRDARTGAQTVTTNGTDQYARVLNGSSDSGTLMWSASDGGAAAVGSLTHAESSKNRYNLIEGFVPVATDVTPTSAGTSTFTPAGSPYGVTSPGNGGGVGGSFAGLAAASGAAAAPAAGVLDDLGQLGRVWSGAGHVQQIHSVGAQLLDTVTTLGPEVFKKYCFAAGTPLLTPEGSKPIEQFRPGDLVLSRDEWDPSGPAEPKVVEEVFTGTEQVITVEVGGKAIRTTTGHPFWVRGRGWTPACDLEPGYELVGHDGQRTRVEKLTETGRIVAVYNLRVADHHTYFVGTPEWGFSVWAHNMSTSESSDPHDHSHEGPSPAFPGLERGGRKTDEHVAKVVRAMSPEGKSEAAQRQAEGEYDAKTAKELGRYRNPDHPERQKKEADRAAKKDAAVEERAGKIAAGNTASNQRAVTVIEHEDGTVSVGLSGPTTQHEDAQRVVNDLNAAEVAEGRAPIYKAATKEVDPSTLNDAPPGTATTNPGECSEAQAAVAAGENSSKPVAYQTAWAGGDATFPDNYAMEGNPRAGEGGPLLMAECGTCQANGDNYMKQATAGSSGATGS
jgi:hypothetical protein